MVIKKKKIFNNFTYVGVNEEVVQKLVVHKFQHLSPLRREGIDILVRQNVLKHQFYKEYEFGPDLLPNNLNDKCFDYLEQIHSVIDAYDNEWKTFSLNFEGLDNQIYQSLKNDILNGKVIYPGSKLTKIKPLLNFYYKNFDYNCIKCFEINGSRTIINNISNHYLNIINEPVLKSLLIKTNFNWVPSILGLTVCNYMSGFTIYNINIYDFCSMQEMHTALFNSLDLITKLTIHLGNSIDLININISNLPSYVDLYPKLSTIEVTPKLIESLDNSVKTIAEIFANNRLILKKVPIIGDLIFKVAEYFCRQEQVLHLGCFVEKTINLSIKYTVTLGNYFHLSNINDFVDVCNSTNPNPNPNTPPVGSTNLILATKIFIGGVAIFSILKYFIN